MLGKVLSGATLGIDGYPVEVEVDVSNGLPSFSTVGLPDNAVKESKDRVKSAIKNSGYAFPAKKITVNLAPAHIKKEGTVFDLPVAAGILKAEGFIENDALLEYLMIGELSLDGRIKPVTGVLPVAACARTLGKKMILPAQNAREASVVEGVQIYGVDTLGALVDFLNGKTLLEPCASSVARPGEADTVQPDLCEVKGQEHVKRALEVAAAGGHNILMIGPPGSGKTMLAKRVPAILPDLTHEEAIETTKVHSVAGTLEQGSALVVHRPFRAPHHTISDIGLIGGGRVPRPGEVSLAHNGVLFLDELPEFSKSALEVLRQPMEDGKVTITRAASSITYPAVFMLVAAMNPCPCGHYGDRQRECRCTPLQVRQYRAKLSGPLLDRIDIHCEVPAVKFSELSKDRTGESSREVKRRVDGARRLQSQRFAHSRVFANGQMAQRHIKKHCALDNSSMKLLEGAVERLGLSARAYNRVLKVARTIADLEGEDNIQSRHISEAIQYRTLDRALG